MDINEALILLGDYFNTFSKSDMISEKDLDIMEEVERTINTFVTFAKGYIEHAG